MDVHFEAFLTWALDGGDWSVHAPAVLSLGNCPLYLLISRWGGPQNRSRLSGEEKNPWSSDIEPLGQTPSLFSALYKQ